MSYTYDLSTDIGLIRLLIYDNNSDSYTFSDEEIQAVLTLNANSRIKTAIQLCYSFSFKTVASHADMIKVDDITIQNSKDKSNFYLQLAKALQKSLEDGYMDEMIIPIYVGGIFQSDLDDNQERQDNNEIVENPFAGDMFDTFNNSSKKYDNE